MVCKVFSTDDTGDADEIFLHISYALLTSGDWRLTCLPLDVMSTLDTRQITLVPTAECDWQNTWACFAGCKFHLPYRFGLFRICGKPRPMDKFRPRQVTVLPHSGSRLFWPGCALAHRPPPPQPPPEGQGPGDDEGGPAPMPLPLAATDAEFEQVLAVRGGPRRDKKRRRAGRPEGQEQNEADQDHQDEDSGDNSGNDNAGLPGAVVALVELMEAQRGEEVPEGQYFAEVEEEEEEPQQPAPIDADMGDPGHGGGPEQLVGEAAAEPAAQAAPLAAPAAPPAEQAPPACGIGRGTGVATTTAATTTATSSCSPSWEGHAALHRGPGRTC